MEGRGEISGAVDAEAAPDSGIRCCLLGSQRNYWRHSGRSQSRCHRTHESHDAILVFIPLLGVLGTSALLGFKIWFDNQLKTQEAPGGDTELLVEAMHQLHDEMGSMREDIAELQERLDFAERMLSEVRSSNAVGPGDST